MKKVILFCIAAILMISVANAQKKQSKSSSKTYKTEYDSLWAKVYENEKKSLPKSALVIVENIYAKAKTEQNNPQFVKAVMYKARLTEIPDKNNQLSQIIVLEQEIEKNKNQVIKSILTSSLANAYVSYFSYNQWEINQRTTTLDFVKTDIETWTSSDFEKHICKLYLSSIENSEILKKTPVRDYSPVLTKIKDSENYRPSLYDLLANEALDYFTGSLRFDSKSTYNFEYENSDYFSLADRFCSLKISKTESLNVNIQAFLLYQNLIAFHLNDPKPDALVDVDIARLDFIYSQSTHPIKDSLYLGALLKLQQKYAKQVIQSEINYELASHYYSQGKYFNKSQNLEKKWYLKKAVEICDITIKEFPETFAAYNCRVILEEIKRPEIEIETEEISIPNQAKKVLLTYKNHSEIYIRIVKITPDTRRDLNEWSKRKYILKSIINNKPAEAWQTNLPDEGDYLNHTTEIAISPLKIGYYVMLISTGKDFSIENDSIIYSTFQISNLHAVYKQLKNDSIEVLVLNRENGEPIQGANVNYYSSEYSNKTRSYDKKVIAFSQTNEQGMVIFKNVYDKNSYSRSKFFEINYDNDSYDPGAFYPNNYKEKEIYKTQTHIFTDRAIYRPGQTVYFKAIVTQSIGDKIEILKNHLCLVELKDANGQVVSKQELTTNEYGSINGNFILPSSGMTGAFHLEEKYGSKQILVEEYKRPKFEVKFQDVSGTYKLEEKVNIKGNVLAFAGNNVDGAKVKYRISRNTLYGNYSYSFYDNYRNNEKEISSGEVVTNEKGEFEISFVAEADKSVNKSSNPTFSFSISVDVTDINGETHSAETSINVGYTALKIAVNVPEKLELENIPQITVSTTNLNGNPEPAMVKLQVYKLKTPEAIFKNQLWEFPDNPLLSAEKYRSLFPNDPYKNENLISSYPKEKLIFEGSYQTADTNEQNFKELKSLEEGVYMLTAFAIDSFGEKVEYTSFFTTFSSSSPNMPDNSPFWFTPLKNTGKPGENASFLIGTKYKDLKVLLEIEHDGKVVERRWISLSNEKRKIEIPIIEKYIGNFAYHLLCVKNNRMYIENELVTVPDNRKKLDISFESFRNKLEPGQKEEWKITIKGKNGEKVAAEFLASMYDASLDEFAANYWYFNLYSAYSQKLNWSFQILSTSRYQLVTDIPNHYLHTKSKYYDGFFYKSNIYGSYKRKYNSGKSYEDTEEVVEYELYDIQENSINNEIFNYAVQVGGVFSNKAELAGASLSFGFTTTDSISFPTYEWNSQQSSSKQNKEIVPRTNFNETAFFFPNLETDTAGNVIVRFTAPESLTRWKMMGLAHTQDLKYGMITKELVTQKKLMILSNPPRFLREGDKIVFSAKVSNLSETEQIGKAELQLFDATTGKAVDVEFKNKTKELDFQIKAGQSQAISWELEIPEGFSALEYKIFARTNESSDGESNTIPILTNRTLVTESMPLPINGNESKSFSFTKLKDSESSSTLKNHKYTLEFTSNPAWYAIQALPYLMEYPYECSEQTFSRYYANTVAAYLANSNPKIKSVFESWKTQSPEALLSNLEKNQELKSLMLEETPWVMEANNESERKKRLGLLFDLNRLAAEKQATESKLLKKQKYNGGWSWFDDGPENQYITQHIVCGFGKLIHLNMIDLKEENQIKSSLQKALKYLDKEMKKEYDDIMKYSKKPEDNHLNSEIIQYLYCRSFFNSIFPIDVQNKKAYDYFLRQADKYWTSQNFYSRGMIALSLARKGEKETPNLIIKSLKENAKYSDEMGMYWENESGWYWYQAPIETQALLIELFDEVAHDLKSVEEMKKWLLKQKQTQDWKTTKATVEACYALMLRGSSQLTSTQAVEIKIANVLIDPKKLDNSKVEAGTGYFKTSWSGDEIKPSMSEITITKKDSGIAWGAVYWQYFENLDKITYAQTPLSIKKNLFVERNSANGPVLQFISDTTQLKVGDKITVRIELRVDRDMEYVHMKDMRASGFEPINVLSQYKWQGGLGYYESTRDAATNFFFPSLNKGTYVFEYSMFVNNSGDFSNGITTIQCMYAPEFTAHSEGVRVKIGK